VLLSETGVRRTCPRSKRGRELRSGVQQSVMALYSHDTQDHGQEDVSVSVTCASVRDGTSCVVRGTKSESMPLTERRAKPRQGQEIGPRFDFRKGGLFPSPHTGHEDKHMRPPCTSGWAMWTCHLCAQSPWHQDWGGVRRYSNTCPACGEHSVVVSWYPPCYLVMLFKTR
jgi:hypothetical protein